MSDEPAPYVPLDWENMGSPLTPFIMLRFPGGPFTFFPDQRNNIYIENATFDVLNENAYSTASITLADPDFVNLENIFARALFAANSFSKDKLTWFCGAIWGWTFYGPSVDRYNLISEREAEGIDPTLLRRTENQVEMFVGKVQQRASGVHYYMLTDLSYDLTDVELRVTFQLADVGSYVFGKGIKEEGGTTVGRLTGRGVSEAGSETSSTSSPDSATRRMINDDLDVEENITTREGTSRPGVGFIGTNIMGGAPPDPEAEPVPFTNYISGVTVWNAIRYVCEQHKPPVQANLRTAEELGNLESLDNPENPVIEGIEIPEDMEFKTAINKLIELFPSRPPTNENEDPEDAPVRETFGIIASDTRGSENTIGGEAGAQLIFGWKINDVLKNNQIKDLTRRYRRARQFVYRPGHIDQVASGKTMIKSLSYDWTSRGYWNMHLPTVFAIYETEGGNFRVFFTEEDYKNAANDDPSLLQSNPSVSDIPLSQATEEIEGLKIHFNFDTRGQGTERYTQQANTIIINVWNFLAKELVNVNIEIYGDPWIDNTLFSPSGTREFLSDLLVDIYKSYFTLTVYKPNSQASPTLVPDRLLSGTYISIKGVSHKISEGDYTTSLQLIKVF